jgi:hypothetical protein
VKQAVEKKAKADAELKADIFAFRMGKGVSNGSPRANGRQHGRRARRE